MKRPALLAFLLSSMLVCAVAGGATSVRSSVPDVKLRLARVPDKEGKPVSVSADGKFRVTDVKPGTWTLTVTVGENYLETWITQELKKRGWKRGAAPEVQAKTPVGKGGGKGKFAEGGAHEFRVVARDGSGDQHLLLFELFATVENTDNKGGKDGGRYRKPMRWHHVRRGLSFKFDIGEKSKGVIEGSLERVVTVE